MSAVPSPEILLAKAFDDLVDSQGAALTFKEEAAMAAKFTQLYVQNLFHLSEMEFKNIMMKNRALHAKATLKEQQGKSPYHVLRKQILRRDNLGKILERYSQHLGALDCILDTKATSALVHHMINLKPSNLLPTKVVGCEFGSGLGILSVAGAIPFVRNGNSLTVHMFEQSQESREDALNIGQILQNESRYRDQMQFHFHSGDITTKEPYLTVKEAEEQSGPIALWISETFGFQSKRPVISENECTFADPSGVPPYSADLEIKYDPLPQVLQHSCDHFESFLQNIREGLILAFPDIVTPRVIIDGEKSSILSPDGTWRKLHKIGLPYDMLPPCVATRWFFKEKSKPPQKKTFQNSKKKKKRK